MNKNEFTELVRDVLEEQGIELSESSLKVLLSKKYLNYKLLKDKPKKTLNANILELLSEAIGFYLARTSQAKRKTKLRDIDVRPALKKRFCSLPPFCK